MIYRNGMLTGISRHDRTIYVPQIEQYIYPTVSENIMIWCNLSSCSLQNICLVLIFTYIPFPVILPIVSLYHVTVVLLRPTPPVGALSGDCYCHQIYSIIC